MLVGKTAAALLYSRTAALQHRRAYSPFRQSKIRCGGDTLRRRPCYAG